MVKVKFEQKHVKNTDYSGTTSDTNLLCALRNVSFLILPALIFGAADRQLLCYGLLSRRFTWKCKAKRRE